MINVYYLNIESWQTAHLDRLTAKPHLSGHAAQGVLLLLLVAESDEAVALAEPRLVKNNLR